MVGLAVDDPLRFQQIQYPTSQKRGPRYIKWFLILKFNPPSFSFNELIISINKIFNDIAHVSS